MKYCKKLVPVPELIQCTKEVENMDIVFFDELHSYDAGIQTEMLEKNGRCRLLLEYFGPLFLQYRLFK